jgi:hypothetical protein
MAAVGEMRACANPACGRSLEGRRADARFCGPRCRKAAWTGHTSPERLERLGRDTNGSEGLPSAGSSTYGEEDVEHGLQAMAIASGNSRKAEALLKQAGYRTPDHTTLNRWATRLHRERYRILQHEMRDELNARRADTHQALSQAYGEIEWEILERLRDKLPEMKGGELATAANKFSIASAVHTDKARIHRDEPTEITAQQVDPIEALRKLHHMGVITGLNPALLGEADEVGEETDREEAGGAMKTGHISVESAGLGAERRASP